MPDEAKLNILLLTHNMAGMGGNFMRSSSLAKELAGLGQNVVLLASRREPGLSPLKSQSNGLQILQMPDLLPQRLRHGGLSPLDVVARCLWVLRNEFDVVHAFDHRPAVFIPAWLARLRWGSLLISDWADRWGLDGIGEQRQGLFGTLLGKLDAFFELRVRCWADGVTVITSELDRSLSPSCVPLDRRLMLPPGSNVAALKPMDKALAREHFKLPQDMKIVGYSGFAPYDEAFLCQTVANIMRQGDDILFISSGKKSPLMGEYLGDQGWLGRWRHFGILKYEEMGRLLACADVLLLPYTDVPINRGRFPNRFGDYLAVGRPMVTNATGDLGRMVTKAGLAEVSPDDPRQFAQAAVKLLRDSKRQKELSRRGRRFAEEVLSWRILAETVLAFYSSF
jgi:glycosyltransferase involved in cell wall biosynthesis